MGKQTIRIAMLGALIALTAVSLTLEAAPPASKVKPPIVVTNADQLQAALVVENANRRIILAPGNYPVTGPLFVPDGATLQGAGVMSGGAMPAGFKPGTASRITPLVPFDRDLLTLGDGVRLSGLLVEHAQGAAGNAVAVRSREAGDYLSVSIVGCEIINPNPLGITPGGPIGEAVLLITLNPNLGMDPPPHDGTQIDLHMDRSIISAVTGGGALFAINFSSNSLISAALAGNVVGGSVRLTGGVSRPDAVSGSTIVVQSQNNLYRDESQQESLPAWQLYGGSSVPIPLPAAETRGNSLHFSSRDDRIEGFHLAVLGAAGVRMNPLPGPASDNRLDLKLQSLSIVTPDDGASTDLSLQGALSQSELLVGDNNVARVLIRQSTGSGYRNNVYADVSGPLVPENQGVGNALVIVGNATAFGYSNSGVLPGPDAKFFEAQGPARILGQSHYERASSEDGRGVPSRFVFGNREPRR
jgi:hypothetical protein